MSSLPPAGWYDDGVTAGVLRWFDGTAWTEHTTANAPQVQAPAVVPAMAPEPVAAPALASTFGSVPAWRIGQSLNLADRVVEDDAFQRNRLHEAIALRRRGFTMFGGALAVLVVTGAIGMAMHGADTVWYVGAAAAVFLCVRAWRDYQNATFRGAPTLTAGGWALAGVALVAALVVLLVGPLVAINSLAHLGDTVGQ
ncbi:DUF2510 domain-containing protein [Cellulomonas soli]|uniref:DUF2510 domain-containing protein n=1 Tax=Cellulomonas soli TaxID=931535 RepID=UPI003F87349B